MWTREELKERAKKAFRRNYWKCVLVALIITVITGSGSNAGSDSEDSSYTDVNHSVTEFVENEFTDWEDSSSGISGAVGTAVDNASRLIADEISPIAVWRLLTGTVFGVFFLLIALAGIFMQIFVLNVAEVGGSRFFLKNAHEPAEVKEILFGFQGSHYLNVVKITFFKNLYLLLWTLLFIIPGIVKSYEYYMIPYLLAENPNMTKEEAFARSREMMYGNKWNTFVLGLSFILWKFLSTITLGIAGIFWVNPYIMATDAELYHRLK